MLQEAVVPVQFGQGVSTKEDPKSVIPGRFLRLENGVFTAPNRVQKRNGYLALGNTIASVGTLSNPKLTCALENELNIADQDLFLSYSSNQDAWLSKGSYQSVELSRNMISTNNGPELTGTLGISDSAILNNYALHVWTDISGKVWSSVMDLSTNTILITSSVYTNGVAAPLRVKAVNLGGTTLCLCYYKAASNSYGSRTVVFSGSGVVSFSAETVIATNVIDGLFDIVSTSTGGAFIYYQSTTPGVTVATLSTALAVSSTNIASTNTNNVHISTTSNGNIWAYWNNTTNDGLGNLTSLTLRYAVFDSSLASVLAATNIVATATPYYVSSMISKSDSTTQQTLFYGLFTTNNAGSKKMMEYTNYITITSAGVIGSATLFGYGVIPISHPQTINNKTYALFVYRSSDIFVEIGSVVSQTSATAPTLFILELSNIQNPPYVLARFAQGVAFSWLYRDIVGITNPNLSIYNTNNFYFTCGLSVQLNKIDPLGGPFANNHTLTIFAYKLDFNSNNNHIAVNSGDITVLNGACVQMYDSASCVELNFHIIPVITKLTGAVVASGLADGTYSYLAVFQWTDNQGNLHQSTPSVVSNITLSSGSPNSVTVTVTTNYLSRKIGTIASLYRTTGAGGTTGSIYYLIDTASVDPSTGIISFVDTYADSQITGNSQAYTYPASSVIENTAPPPSSLLLSHNNRLWLVDSENPNTVWYTKSFQPLVGISPSDSLIVQYDPKFGNISGLGEMDEKLIIGKKKGFFVQAGDGADDTGAGSTLSFPQMVPSDVGITQAKSIITQPSGMMFKSDNGIYILTRALQVVYIGADIEAYNSQTITSANLVPGKSELRFLCSSGVTLVYDYIYNQWSTFTNHTGSSATIWNGYYVYANSSGRIYRENQGSYLDDATAFSLLSQTSWLSFAGIQGFQRVRRLIVLGDFVNGNSASHNLSIQAAYDFSSTFQSAIAYGFGAASAQGVFQYRERLPIQKCDSVSLLIQETTTGSSAEYVDLTNISFEVGVKKGVNKLGGIKSVG